MYEIRTDLAIENREIYKERNTEESKGVKVEKKEESEYTITRVKILDQSGSKNLGKPIGTYVTIDVPNLDKTDEDLKDQVSKVLAIEIKALGKNNENSKILIVGLGNKNITPDALGPEVVDRVLVTRQFFVNYNKEIDETVANVAAISPGVMGITGIETAEIVKGVVEKIRPDLVIAIDSLASRKMDRISTTIQISDTGINPGSGIGNNRASFDEKTLGVPVIGIGVPTVVDAATIVNDTLDLIIDSLISEAETGSEFYTLLSDVSSEDKYTLIQEVLQPFMKNVIVTPTDIDALIDDLSIIVANGLNMALHPGIDLEDVNRYLK